MIWNYLTEIAALAGFVVTAVLVLIARRDRDWALTILLAIMALLSLVVSYVIHDCRDAHCALSQPYGMVYPTGQWRAK